MAPHSSTPAWKIPWAEEPGRLQSMGSLRVGHDWVTSLSLFTFMLWRRKRQPTPVFLPGESQGRAGWWGWWAAVYGVAQSRTQLKRLSSSSRITSKCCKERDPKKYSQWPHTITPKPLGGKPRDTWKQAVRLKILRSESQLNTSGWT